MMNNKELFYYFIQEREAVRIRREEKHLPAPWTDDIILQSVRFTNIDREKDKTTIYIRNRVKPNRWIYANTALCRIINRPELLDKLELISDSNYRDYCDYLKDKLEYFNNNFGGFLSRVYIINPVKGENQVCNVAKMIQSIIDNNSSLIYFNTCVEVFDYLIDHARGIGSFMATQIIVDIMNTPNTKLYNDPNKYSYTSMGPGSQRGISIYFDKNISGSKFMGCLKQAHEETIHRLELSGDKYNLIPVLNYHNLQNCFCEYQKYFRNIYTEKRSRNRKLYNNGDYTI